MSQKNFIVKNGVDAGGDITSAGVLKSTASAANEGGQIELSLPSSGSSLAGTNVTIDVYQNKLRFFESGTNNRGAYIDLTQAANSAGTNLLGGVTGAMNASYTYATKQSGVSGATTLVSVSITTNGYPIQVMATGDMENNSAGGWVTLQLYRGSTAIGNIVHAESSAGSENVPFALTALDVPAAGTYTYSLKINTSAGGTFNFGESNGPTITVIELAGPKGDTGPAGSSGMTNPMTTAGDIIVGGTSGAATRLAIGAASKVLTVLSGTPSWEYAVNATSGSGITITNNTVSLDTELQALSGLTSAADTLPYFTGIGTAGTTTLTTFGRSLIDDTDAATARTTLGLGSMATATAADYATLSGATFTGGIITATPSTTVGALRIPHGAALTTPVNGDIWTTTSGLFARINGATVGPFSATTGTVTSVGLSLPAEFSVTTSTVTSSGTLTASWANATQKTFFAGPAGVSAGTPSFRAIAFADLPTVYIGTTGIQSSSANQAISGVTSITGGTGTTNITTTTAATASTSTNSGATNITTGNATGITSTSGLVAISTGTGTSNTGGISIISGNATGTSGSISIDTGTGATRGVVSIGYANAASVDIGRTGITTTVNGTLTTPTLDLTTAATATAATSYFIETGSDGVVRPKTLANVKTEILGNGFLTFTGPTTSTKTITLPDSNATLLATNGSGSSLTFGTGSLSLAGNLTTSGAFGITLTATALTSVTLPTSGTLISTAANTFTGSQTFRAGTATAGTAPVYFQSGVNLTTAAAGAMEFDGTNLYFTPSTTRRTVAFLDSPTFTGTVSAALLDLTTLATSTAATSYFVETGSDGIVRPKSLANVQSEIVTAATVLSVSQTSGSTTASTIKYNGTTAAAGQLDGGTTAPSGTTRLNYGGYLYATRLQSDTYNTITGAAASASLFSDVTTGTITVGSGLTSGSVTIGSALTSSTGTINIGTFSTSSFTVNIATGSNGSLATKTLNLGTGGAGGASNVNIGNTAGTVTINSTNTSLGGTASATTALNAPTFDIASAGTLNIGTTNASTVLLASSGVETRALGYISGTSGIPVLGTAKIRLQTGTSANTGGTSIESYGNAYATARYHIVFSTINSGGTATMEAGRITTINGTTSYTSPSDYRLKENITPLSNSIDKLMLLKPSKFNYIGGDVEFQGFVAHEVQPIVPQAVDGEKDAVDDEGNPQYQAIDQAKLVPLLTAALQDAVNEIESLKSRLDAAGL